MNNQQNFNGQYNQQYNNGYNVPVKKTNGFAIAGFILAFFTTVISIVLCIIGIAKAKECNSGKGLAIAGLILNILKIIATALLVVLVFAVADSEIGEEFKKGFNEGYYCPQVYECDEPTVDGGKYTCKYRNEDNNDQIIECDKEYVSPSATIIPANPIIGNYDCRGVDSTSADYTVSIEFTKDEFRYGPYNDLDNNHITGTYTYDHEEEKDGKVAGYKYYYLYFNGNTNDFIVDGVLQADSTGTGVKKFEGEIGLTTVNGKKSGALIFTSSYNTYYCSER